jgi:hypothetical protein
MRWEVEGALRNLSPLQGHARRVHRARSGTRRRARIGVALLLGVGMVGALAVARIAPSTVPALAMFRDDEWGTSHVGSYHIRSAPLIPLPKLRGWRARAAHDPATGKSTKLARD